MASKLLTADLIARSMPPNLTIVVRRATKETPNNSMVLSINFADFMESYISWREHGLLIQDAFFYLTIAEREFIQTGITLEGDE